MRWTSTPSTPEPSPRPNAAIASRARSRIAASTVPQRRGDLLAQRVEVDRHRRLARVGVSPISSRAASASAARKKKRSNTSSNDAPVLG